MENYSVKAILSVADNGFTSTVNSAVNSLGDLENKTGKASSGILSMSAAFAVAEKAVSLVANTIKSSLGKAISRVDTMNRFPKVMQQVGFSAEKSETAIEKLSEGINGLPTALDDITASTQKLALLTGDLEKATDTSLALNDAFYASGASAEDASRGLVQYTQMLSKGKVDIQSWRILQETMGVALYDLAEAFGYTGASAQNDLYEALKGGEIAFDELNSKLIELDSGVDGFAERAKTASAGIATSFGNLGTAVVRGLANTINAVDTSLQENGLPGFQQQIESVKGGVNAAFNEITENAENLVTTVAPAVKLVADNLDVLTATLTPVAAGFVALKAVDTATGYLQKFNSARKEAGQQLVEMNKALKLSSQAAELNAKATDTARRAAELDAKARQASEDALKAETIAKQLTTAASKAQESADRANAKAASARAEASQKSAMASIKQATADEAAAIAEKASTKAAEANAAAQTVSNNAISAKTLLLGVLSGEIGIATAAQTAWNAAMAANPIGTVITAVSVLATVISGVYKALDKLGVFEDTVWKKTKNLREETEALVESLEENDSAYEENISSAQRSAGAIDNLVGKVVELSEKEEKSADDKARLQSYVEQLNGSIDDLNLSYDEEEKKLNMTAKALKNKAKAYKTQKIGAVYTERYNELIEDQIKLDEELEKAKELHKETQEKVNDSMAKGSGATTEYSVQLLQQGKTIADLEKKKAEYAQQEEKLTSEMVANQAAYTAAVKANQAEQQAALAESIANQTVSLEELSEANQETVESLQKGYQDVKEAATDMFDTISTKSDLSVSQMIENLQKNNAATTDWGNNMESLRDRFAGLGLDAAILDQLAELGTDGAGYVAELVTASDEQLGALVTEYESAGENAGTAYLQGLGVDSDKIPEAIQDMITQTESSMRETVESTDWSSLGESMASGTAEGITENAEQVSDAAKDMTLGGRVAAGEAVGEGSPATSFIELGENMVAGLVLGLSEDEAAIAAASKIAVNIMQAVEATLDKADFSDAGSTLFSGMVSSAEDSMGELVSVVKSDMQSISGTVNEGMALSKRYTANGMTGMNSAMSSGMDKAKKIAANGADGIVSAFSGLQSRMYSIGDYAMQGLTNGLNANAWRAIAAANSIANSIATTMESALKVGSPSKVTTKIGEWAGIGPAIGMLNMLPKVKKASNKLAAAMVPVTVADFTGMAQKYDYSGSMEMYVRRDSTEDSQFLAELKEIRELLQNEKKVYNLESRVELDGRTTGYGVARYVEERNTRTADIKKWLNGER